MRAGGPDRAPAVGGADLACSVGGPWFEDLHVGQVFADAPGLTLTDGHAALHQAIVGDRMTLTLYSRLELECLEPLPGGGGLAHLRARLHVVDEADRRRDVLDWRFVAALA
jgi:hypothetical protein